ncbi:hypothetical protein Ahy_B05g078549 [Arachis hypogaea]|uniref:Endonuclease/exonuclease/phosphatase domain-containing protein n=1 Tax=Arachis hypogaea TaxID=3818 RepID=A0A444Z7D0_ARAHY|nr:hypothetical protein Ahy_B05g078549 [Arachis hypogaea]
MNLLAWNCRGAGGKAFSSLIRDLQKEYKVSFFILVETHLSGSRGKSMWEKFGLDGYFIEKARGHSGRVDILSHNYQMVNTKVQYENSECWLLSTIYAISQRVNRTLWNNICDLILDNDLPWWLIGDFNATLLGRRGGSANSRNACKDFQSCVSETGLLDMGFSRWPFT